MYNEIINEMKLCELVYEAVTIHSESDRSRLDSGRQNASENAKK